MSSHSDTNAGVAFPGPNDGKGSPNHLDDVVLSTSHSQPSSHVVMPSFLPASPPRSVDTPFISPSPSKRKSKSGELEADAVSTSTDLASSIAPAATTPRPKKAKKTMQWADGGHVEGEDATPLEIVVDDGRRDLNTVDSDEVKHQTHVKPQPNFHMKRQPQTSSFCMKHQPRRVIIMFSNDSPTLSNIMFSYEHHVDSCVHRQR